MKILAIRGGNLASLAGDFAVDFTVPPLADAGLFAITGPTGAGKSTLLDALCLALYNEMPRLIGASKALVGAHDDPGLHVAADKVGSILRHGAGRGYAEVDFLGHDGKPYRSRWEIWRTRNRPDGKLQDPQLRLTDMTSGVALGTTRSETAGEIVRVTGLTFDQFRRSVLLAQGDFDAFLKAKPGERAALLELMTGTEIYGRLSVAAFERAKAERGAMDDIGRDLAALRLLDDDERAALLAAQEAAQQAATAAEAAVQQLETDQRWWTRTAELTRLVADAEAELERRQTEELAAAPLRAAVAAAEIVAPLRPLLAEVRRLEGEQQALNRQRDDAVTALGSAQAAVEAAGSAVNLARSTEIAAEQRFADAQPLIDRALTLDTRIDGGQQTLAAARTTETTARVAADDRRLALQNLQGELAACLEAATAASDWLVAHSDQLPLAEELPRWLEKLAEWDEARTRTDEIQYELTQRRGAAEAAREAADSAAAALTRLDAALADDLGARDALDAQLAGRDEAALTARFSALAALENLLTRLKAAEDRATRATLAIDRLETQAARAATDILQATADIASLTRRQADDTARLAEAEQAYALAEAAAGQEAAALRARLVTGQPCPVCGSTVHPAAAEPTAMTALLDRQRARVRTLKDAVRDDEKRLATAEATRKSAGAVQNQLAAERPAAEAERDGAADDCRALRSAVASAARAAGLEGVGDPASAHQRAAPIIVLESVATARQEAGNALNIVQALRRQRDAKVQAIEATQGRRLACARTLSEAERDLASAKAEGERLEGALAEQTQRRQTAEAALAAPLSAIADWQTRPLDVIVAACRQVSEAVAHRRQAVADGRQRQATLSVQLDTAATALAEAEAAATAAAAVLRDAQERLQALQGERQTLFDGQPTTSVREALEHCRTAAQQAARAAERQHGEDLQALAVIEAGHQAATAALASAAAAAFEARCALDSGLAATGLDPAVAEQALAREAGWMTNARETLAGLSDGRRAAESVRAERLRAEAEHRAIPQPALSGDILAQAIAEQRTLLDTGRRSAAEHAARLHDDDARRQEGRQLQTRIAAQRMVCDLWDGIAEVIGQADGAKFRRFAQSLTLDRLLELANQHLADLTPRYRLQRAPGGELDLQVIDRDMGGDIRSVAALSGGERFLTSLALALGLAGMTSGRTVVQSLFIDEGFGSLDATSLDTAISALETLHAAGRKIGVISHVQPMVERIGVRVQVARHGGGRSTVSTVAG